MCVCVSVHGFINVIVIELASVTVSVRERVSEREQKGANERDERERERARAQGFLGALRAHGQRHVQSEIVRAAHSTRSEMHHRLRILWQCPIQWTVLEVLSRAFACGQQRQQVIIERVGNWAENRFRFASKCNWCALREALVVHADSTNTFFTLFLQS